MSKNLFRIAECSIERLLELFNLKEPLEQMINEVDLNYYARESGLAYYPVKITKIPPIGCEVESYIRKKAQLDLPKSQFSDKPGEYSSEKFSEVGGSLGFKGELYEITYKRSSSVYHEKNKGSVFVEKPKNIVPGTTIVVGWHTHKNKCLLSKGDSETGNIILNSLPSEVDYYEVLYCPQFDEFKWHAYKPA